MGEVEEIGSLAKTLQIYGAWAICAVFIVGAFGMAAFGAIFLRVLLGSIKADFQRNHDVLLDILKRIIEHEREDDQRHSATKKAIEDEVRKAKHLLNNSMQGIISKLPENKGDESCSNDSNTGPSG